MIGLCILLKAPGHVFSGDRMRKEDKAYEIATVTILNHLREKLAFERAIGSTRLRGVSGTEWNLDAVCYGKGSVRIVLVECRRKAKRRVEQEEMAGFAYRVRDVGASAGLVVTPIGFQRGAKAVAKYEKIGMATLNPEATEQDYALRIAEQLFAGKSLSGQLSFAGSLTLRHIPGGPPAEVSHKDKKQG